MKNFSFGVYIISTPIGNLDDISQRAIDTLSNVDIIVCENPKHSLKLLNKFGIKKKLISLHDYNENKIIETISHKLSTKNIALISDAGSPMLSDPGYKFIKHCINNNINITSLPGANSLIPALQLSGITMNQFLFLGFFPKNKKQMLEFFDKISKIKETSVFFVSNHKLRECLDLLESHIKNREISISKELTKINERIFRGVSDQIKHKIAEQDKNFKGEFVVVVEGNNKEETKRRNLEDYNKEINILLSKFSLTDVVEIVHKLTGITKNKVYKWVLELKKL